jgi:hypothetical protein
MWCDTVADNVNGHEMKILVGSPMKTPKGVAAVGAVIPSYYAAPSRVADLLAKHGRTGAAKFIKEKLPTSKAIKSGDLGEILGTAYLSEFTIFKNHVKRLRWKDHRNMAMRGEDVLAFGIDPKGGQLVVIKGEAKSRVNLAASVVATARKALCSNKGHPSAHAMSFLADRFFEQGDTQMADMLDDAQLKKRIPSSRINHLLFTFSANDPTKILRKNLSNYSDNIRQLYVGVQVVKHQEFIKSVFDVAATHGV